ncbi:MAG: hypothetical protein JNK37_07920 [Verrucomicrobiales bacterium]|nr:hypothetical protein [Verrucomicrobiales bacterium]
MPFRRFVPLTIVAACCAFGFAAAQSDDPSDTPLVEDSVLEQLRLVEDPDGHTNVRTAPQVSADVAGRIPSGSIVAVDPEPQGGFHRVYFDDASRTEPRYMHGSRLKPVTGWNQIAPVGATGRLLHRGFEARVSGGPFSPAEHKVTHTADGVALVNGKVPWGQDGGVPRRLLTLTVAIGGQPVALPLDVADNLYEPNVDSLVLLTPGDPAERALLLMVNSDGAGAYCVVWAFEKGAYRGRAVFAPF